MYKLARYKEWPRCERSGGSVRWGKGDGCWKPGFGGLWPLQPSSSTAAAPNKNTRLVLARMWCKNVAKTDTGDTRGADLPDGLTAAGVAMLPLTRGKRHEIKRRWRWRTIRLGEPPARDGRRSVRVGTQDSVQQPSLTSASTEQH